MWLQKCSTKSILPRVSEQDLIKLLSHKVSFQNFRTKRRLPIKWFQACRTKNVIECHSNRTSRSVFLPKYRRVNFRVRGFHLVFSYSYHDCCHSELPLLSWLSSCFLDIVSSIFSWQFPCSGYAGWRVTLFSSKAQSPEWTTLEWSPTHVWSQDFSGHRKAAWNMLKLE